MALSVEQLREVAEELRQIATELNLSDEQKEKVKTWDAAIANLKDVMGQKAASA